MEAKVESGQYGECGDCKVPFEAHCEAADCKRIFCPACEDY